MLKKVLAIAVATSLLASAAIFPASAATVNEGDTTVAQNGDIVKMKNGDKLKVFCSFETSEVGHLIGNDNDVLFSYDGNGPKAKSKVSIEAVGENGSHGLQFQTKDNFGAEDSAYCQTEYEGYNEQNVVNNFEGASAYGFWVDTTDCADGTDPCTAEFLFGEQDCDENGNLYLDPAKKTPAGSEYNISAASAVYYIQNPDGTWKEMTNSKSAWLNIPLGYKGYVKVPFDSYELVWGKDADGKINMKNVMSTMLVFGIWKKNIGHKGLILDNVGFFGDYPDPVTTTTATEPTATTTATVTTLAPVNNTTTAAPTGNQTDATEPETTTAAENQNPKTGSGSALPALLITATAAAALAFIKKKAK